MNNGIMESHVAYPREKPLKQVLVSTVFLLFNVYTVLPLQSPELVHK